MAATTLGVPLQQTLAAAAGPSSSHTSNSSSHASAKTTATALHTKRSGSTFRTPNSSENDLSTDGSHITNQSAQSHAQHALSLSPPPDLSWSRSSLHSDQEHEFLSRNGGGIGSSTSFNQPYLTEHSVSCASSHPAPEHIIRLASSSQGHHDGRNYPYSNTQNDGSWGSRHSGKTNHAAATIGSKSRIRLDSIFGTQLPGFPYLNSAAAATSSALGHPINPQQHYTHHHGSTSSADLLRSRASYNWTERSGSAASHASGLHARAATSHSMRSTARKESVMSAPMGGRQRRPQRPGTAASNRLQHGQESEMSCSADTGESNSSDEVDLDLSFDMDLLRARQLQQFQARQQRELQERHAHHHAVGITSSQVQAQRQARDLARARALSSAASTSAEGYSRSGHIGIDMHQHSSDSLGLPADHDDVAHRRYVLGGKKRLSRSAVELRPKGSSNGPYASTSSGSTPRGSMPAAYAQPQNQYPSGQTSQQIQHHTTSRASLDLAVDIPLDDEDNAHAPRPAFMDDDESSAQLGWSFATTPPLSPAEIVTFAEGSGNMSAHKPVRRYSAGASNLFHSLEKKNSSSEMLQQRKRRPSFPLMSLIDKAVRAPVAGMAAAIRSDDAAPHPHSPDSEASWGSPTPRESVLLDHTTTTQASSAVHQHGQRPMHTRIPLIPIPANVAQDRNLRLQASISDLAETPDSLDAAPLPAPPRLHDPAKLDASPASSAGTPGTLSPDICLTNSTFSSPRSPSDDLPTPRTTEFVDHNGNRHSHFSHISSDAATSFNGISSEALEAVKNKRASKAFEMWHPSLEVASALHVIPEDSGTSQRTAFSASSSSSITPTGTSPKELRRQSASGQSGGDEPGTMHDQSAAQQDKSTQGHKRQSSSLFRFPFVSSLRNPFTSRPATPSIITTNSPNPAPQSPSNSQESPSAANEELLSGEAIAVGIARKDVNSTKRSDSPSSSEGSHFLTPTDPPSPPRPGATTQASKGVDPSMLRDGPNTGKGRLSGLGLSFPSTFVSSQQRSVSQGHTPAMQHHQSQRQSSLPVLSFSSASDEQHEGGSRSVESEEAAIQVVPDENGYGRPIRPRTVSTASANLASPSNLQPFPRSAPATTVHFHQPSSGLDNQMARMHPGESGAQDRRTSLALASHESSQVPITCRRPRTRLLSGKGLDLRNRVDRMRPSQLLFLAAFIAGPWCFIIGGWCLRPLDGDYSSVKGIRCRCPNHSECCDCQAEIYKQIKLSGGQVDRVLQSQNGEVRKMDRFVMANRVAALTCGTGTLVIAITALIVVGRAW